MTPELKLSFHQKMQDLQINASMGVDEKNISKIHSIVHSLYYLTKNLYQIAYPVTETTLITKGEDGTRPIEGSGYGLVSAKPENDTAEATQELRTKVKPHRPEAK